MNTVFLSRTKLEEIILNCLNLNARPRVLAGVCIDSSEFYDVAIQIVDAIIESQDDYDEDDYFDDDDELEFYIYDEDEEEYDSDDDDDEYEFDDMEDDIEEYDEAELF